MVGGNTRSQCQEEEKISEKEKMEDGKDGIYRRSKEKRNTVRFMRKAITK